MSRFVQCPVCWHGETMRARRNGGDPIHVESARMYWERPSATAGGQIITPYTHGCWCCEICGVRLNAGHAFALIDAALSISDPHCDSRDEEGHYQDALRAAKGGRDE